MTTGESKKMACGYCGNKGDEAKEIRRLKRENKKLQAAKEEQEAAAKLATEHGLQAIRDRNSAEIQLNRAQTAAAKAMVLEAERDEARQQRDQARKDLDQSRGARSTPYSRELDASGYLIIRTGPSETWVKRERFDCVVGERDRLRNQRDDANKVVKTLDGQLAYANNGVLTRQLDQRDEDGNRYLTAFGEKWVLPEDEKKRDEKYTAQIKKEQERRYKAEDAADQLRKEINDVRTKWGEFLAADSWPGKVAAAEAQVTSLKAEVKTAYAKVKEHDDAIGQLRRLLTDTAARVCRIDASTRTWLYDQPTAIRDWLGADCARGYFLRGSTGSYGGFRPSSFNEYVGVSAPETVTVHTFDGPRDYVPESRLTASQTAHAGIVKANIELRCKADRCDRAEQVLVDVRKALGETAFFTVDPVKRAQYLRTQIEQITDALEKERKAHDTTRGDRDQIKKQLEQTERNGYVSYFKYAELAYELDCQKKGRQAAEQTVEAVRKALASGKTASALVDPVARARYLVCLVAEQDAALVKLRQECNAAETVKTEALRTVKELEPFMAIVNNVRPMINALLPHING
jgi:hypothetical protein